ncbi:hypothetical protein ACLB2K_072648 [Fragaria x ananassa]
MPHVINRARSPLLRVAQALRTPRLPYHSMTQKASPRITTPHRDHSASSDVAKSNWLITKLSRDGRIREARQVFDEMPERDVVTWTTVITAYVKSGMLDEARSLFDRADAVKNVITWTALVGGYIRLRRRKEAEMLFYQMPVRNVVSWNTMIDGYARSRRVDEALELFERMPERNVVSWNTVLTALAQCGRIEEARRLFGLMPERDVISWTTMVAGLSRNGRVDEARDVFDRMPRRNVVSWNAMVTGYAQNGRLEEALELFERMPERDMPSWNTMVTGFIQNGDLERAWELYVQMPQKNVISWTTMITGYVQDGRNEEALMIFSKMVVDNGVRPNQGTFGLYLLEWNDCSLCTSWMRHAGLVEEGLNLFDELLKDGSIRVREDHYTCLVDLCGRAGRLKEAFDILEKLGTNQSASNWGALLAGCIDHHNMDTGKLAAEKLLNEVPDDAGSYSLLWNFFARFGNWREAAKMRIKMKEKGLKKQPGCSWIEVGNMVHVFVVGDKSHCQSQLIYYALYGRINVTWEFQQRSTVGAPEFSGDWHSIKGKKLMNNYAPEAVLVRLVCRS